MAIDKKNVGVFVGGALIGAVVALLLAPAKGVDTRKKVGDWVKDKAEEGKKLLAKGKIEATTQSEKLNAALKAGKQAYEGFQNNVKEKVSA